MTLPDIDTLSTFGGALVNLSPVEDPTTDRDAAAANKAYSDAAMVTHTAARVWVRLTGATTAAPTVTASDAVWGASSASAPTVARTAVGVFTLTYLASVNDELGVAHTTNFRAAFATVEGATPLFAQASVTAANVITLQVFTVAGAASDFNTLVIFVAAI